MNNEMTTDNMSNEEVIEVLKGIVFNGFDRTTRKERQALDLAIKALEKRTQGEWIIKPKENSQSAILICDKCNHFIPITIDKNFCPNCGAVMQKGE